MDEESEEVKRVLKRLKKRSSPKIFITIAFTLGGVAVLALLWISIDFFLSANQTTARPWEELKAEFSRDIHSTGVRIFGGAAETVQGIEARECAAAGASSCATERTRAGSRTQG